MEVAARIGWIARGVLYLLIALLLARMSSSSGGATVDKKGAFAALAESPFGGWTLGAVALGLAGFAAFRLWAAVRGTDEKTNRRLGWLVSAIVYAGLCALAVGVLLGGSNDGNGEKAMTTRILTWPGGQLIVGAIAAVVVAVAANYVRKGVKERFLHDIDEGAVPDRLHPVVRVVGVAGWLGRALVWALVGWFLLKAAVQHDANEPVGLDETLHALLGESWGVTVLWVAFAGLLAYGVLCMATAAWPDPEPDSEGG